MARARVIKKQDRCFVELPKEFLSNDEVEIFPLKEGYYLLSLPLPEGAKAAQGPSSKPETTGAATAEEIAVLHKLQSIKFGDRTPGNVAKLLGGGEKAVLGALERRGWVNIFRGDKYRDGVYNIADEVYPMLKAREQPARAQENPKSGQTAGQDQPPSYALLAKQGYLVIRDQKDAKAVSEMLKTDMKAGSVVGTKGFDGAFYVVTRNYFERASSAILETLRADSAAGADAGKIATACRLEPDGVRAVLQQLAESGDVIEKRKGTYAAV
jgi:hypothetical protein